MIPHHQNAVNMAKTLLKLGGLSCGDLLNEDETDCIMVNMMRDTINSQNQQIQAMRNILEALQLPYADDCVVTVTSSEGTATTTSGDGSSADSAAAAGGEDGEGVDPDDYDTATENSASASTTAGSTSSGPAPPSASSSSSSTLLWISAILPVLCWCLK
jgi:Domain of unknown function (DUF305)